MIFYRRLLFSLIVALMLQGCGAKSNDDLDQCMVSVFGLRCLHPVWTIAEIDPNKHGELSNTFILENDSDQEIRIRSVKADCGCIFTEKGEKTVAARGRIGIPIRFSPPPTGGAIQRRIVVTFDGNKLHGTLELKVVGFLKPTKELFASPPYLDFGTITTQEKTRTTRICRRDGGDIGFKNVVDTSLGSLLNIRELDEGRTLEVSVTLSETSTNGIGIPDRIELDTHDPIQRSIVIPIKGITNNAKEIFIDSLFVGSMGPGEKTSRSVFRRSIDKFPRMMRVEYVGDRQLDVRLESTEIEGRMQGRVTIEVKSAAGRKGVVEGIIRVYLDERGPPITEIPVSVFVR